MGHSQLTQTVNATLTRILSYVGSHEVQSVSSEDSHNELKQQIIDAAVQITLHIFVNVFHVTQKKEIYAYTHRTTTMKLGLYRVLGTSPICRVFCIQLNFEPSTE